MARRRHHRHLTFRIRRHDLDPAPPARASSAHAGSFPWLPVVGGVALVGLGTYFLVTRTSGVAPAAPGGALPSPAPSPGPAKQAPAKVPVQTQPAKFSLPRGGERGVTRAPAEVHAPLRTSPVVDVISASTVVNVLDDQIADGQSWLFVQVGQGQPGWVCNTCGANVPVIVSASVRNA